MAFYYLVNVLILLGVTTLLKRVFNRPRPTRPDYENPDCKNGRTIDLRTRETNASFPSGDAAQAGLFCFFLMINYQSATKLLGGPMTTAQFVLTVSFSRVYFHCHYMGDVMFGLMVGLFTGIIINRIGLKDVMKTAYLATGLGKLEEESLYDEF